MRQSYGQLISWATTVATIVAMCLFLIKIFAWWYTNSVSLLATLIDSLIDISASFTNLLIVRYSLQPADDEHKFGHGKAEPLAALVQSIFIFSSALFLILTGVQHFIFPVSINDPDIGATVTIIALISTIILIIFQYWIIKKTQSQAIRADMIHYQTDVMINSAILVALWLTWHGWYRADAFFALGIGIYTLYNSLHVGNDAVQSLLDRALPREEQREIFSIVASYLDVNKIYNLRTRQSGPTKFIQIYLKMEDNLSLVQTYIITKKIEQEILRRFPGSDIIIHHNPYST